MSPTESLRLQLDKVSTLIQELTRERDAFLTTSKKEVEEASAEVDKLAPLTRRADALYDALQPLDAFLGFWTFAATVDSASFLSRIKNAREAIKSTLKHESAFINGYKERLVDLETILSNHWFGVELFIDGTQAFYAQRPGLTQNAADVLEEVEYLCETRNDLYAKAKQELLELREKEEASLKSFDQRIAEWAAKRDALTKKALAVLPDISPLLPEITRERLAAAPGCDCPICTERLCWPSDATLLGRENCHLAVMFKCCAQFVGESCARRLLLAGEKPKCPFCRAALVVDGSVNKVVF